MRADRGARLLGLALLWLLARPATAQVLTTLRFEGRAEQSVALVSSGGREVLRLVQRDATAAAQLAADLTAALNAAAERSTGTHAFSLAGRPPTLMLDGRPLLAVTPELAERAKSTPAYLAPLLLAALQQAFDQVYLVARPLRVPLDAAATLTVGGQPEGASFVVEGPVEPLVDVAVAPDFSRVQVIGRQLGSTSLTLVRRGIKLKVPVDVLPPAGRVLGAPRLVLTGNPEPAVVREALAAALEAVVEHAPGTSLNFELPASLPKAPGGSVALPLAVRGGGCLPVDTSVPLTVQWADAPTEPASRLLVSNSPERVDGPLLLLRGTLPAHTRTRLLGHHLNVSDGPLVLQARLVNTGETPARVHVALSGAGPTTDEIYCGHVATLGYWQQRRRGSGYVVSVPPHTAWSLAGRGCGPRGVVSVLGELSLLDGPALELQIVATTPDDARPGPRPATASPSAPRDGWLLDKPRLSVPVAWQVGGAPLKLAIGEGGLKTAAGQELKGNYGVEYAFDLTFDNPTAEPHEIEFVASPRGGVARLAYLLDGEVGETALLPVKSEHALLAFLLPPGGKQQCRLLIMPQAGCSYPIRFTTRERLR